MLTFFFSQECILLKDGNNKRDEKAISNYCNKRDGDLKFLLNR
ncbi:hypothetical protein B4119_1713 [Parageobacillus caldoxylosilyticus]|uniref:Uncharacterized protein n=1 Tax=Saccharococcus caldoxylosilyticus TaxID=81408 RepID=A0A150LLN9_9BACL|nr:hypothetical protein B4119_1713 [Parageobacillus caldoxylosilyticus]